MSLSAQGAFVRGGDYQHVIGWLKVCEMLTGEQPISTVCMEDQTSGAFDDVVVRLRSGTVICIQAKTSVSGDKAIDWDYLSKSKPKGQSPLQHWHDTYTAKSEAGLQFSLEVWTTRSFDHRNPILGKLRDQKHEMIDTDEMLDAGPRSRVGKERDLWAKHLGVSAKELAEFLKTVRWKHTASEHDLRKQTKPLMRLAGLRADDGAVDTGIAIVRGWIADGLGEQTDQAVGHIVREKGLIPGPSPLLNAERASDLPPSCSELMETLKVEAPETADLLSLLLAEKSSRLPGVLESLAENPPDWLRHAGHVAWETLGDFLKAHRLPGSLAMRHQAIERESPRSDLHKINEAISTAADGDVARADALLSEVAEDHPLLGAAQAIISDDPAEASARIEASAAIHSDDRHLALSASFKLMHAYQQQEMLEAAIMTARETALRFPDRAEPLMARAELSLDYGRLVETQGNRRSDVLETAARAAINARDLFRMWEGPAADAVALAAEALLILGDPQQAVSLTMLPPDGDARPGEARDERVVEFSAHALLTLGRYRDLDKLNLESVDASKNALLRAMQAHSRAAPDAADLMRAAVHHAADNRSRFLALRGLAEFGETDETALAALAEEELGAADLVRATVLCRRGDSRAAISLLEPYLCESAAHVTLLSNIQRDNGSSEDAYETLIESAQALNNPFLYRSAVETLIDLERFEEAEQAASATLATNPPRAVEMYLRSALIAAAGCLRDWTKLEDYGMSFAEHFPEHSEARWSVVYARHRQAEHEAAWRYLVEHDLRPNGEQDAKLAITLYDSLNAPADSINRILLIASEFSDSEEVAGIALAALMTRQEGHFQITSDQESQIAEMLRGANSIGGCKSA